MMAMIDEEDDDEEEEEPCFREADDEVSTAGKAGRDTHTHIIVCRLGSVAARNQRRRSLDGHAGNNRARPVAETDTDTGIQGYGDSNDTQCNKRKSEYVYMSLSM